MRALLSVAIAGTLLASFSAAAQSPPPSEPGLAARIPGIINQTPTGEVADLNAATEAQAAANPRWLKDAKTACAILTIEGVPADAARWSGQCAQGFANGPGTATLSRQGKFLESLSGIFDRGALRAGYVEIKWADGSHYTGNAAAARMDGTGILITATGDHFEGQWSAGQLSGHGSALWANGDRYEGDWQNGKASGHGIQIWSDGHKYEGEWQNDQPNGHGIVTRKDGSRFEANFVDGRPQNPTLLPAVAVSDGPAVQTPTPSAPPDIAAPPPAATADKTDTKTAASTGDAISHPPPPAIAGIAGKRLFGIDGSSLTLTANEDGIAREIVAPNGSAKKNQFAFLSDRVGAVSDTDDNDKVVGVFRLTDKGIITNYSDGRSETLFPNSDGGISMVLNAPSGEAYCMAWYPQGHRFSIEEKKAALAAYASHLGIGLEEPRHGKKNKAAAPKPTCSGVAAAAAPPSAARRATASAAPAPIPRPGLETATAETQPDQRAMTATAAAFMPPAPRGPNQVIPDQVVEVRPSIVHTIDPDPATAANGPNSASASTCLSVESDGQHWDFHNHCGYDVQFAYCLMNADDPLASCSKGAISGSVAANGSSALIADKGLNDTNADHDFRWVACGGGAGEVVVHLDQSDPPTGRCVRPGAS